MPLQISYAAFVESIAFSDSKGGTPDAASAKRVRDTYPIKQNISKIQTCHLKFVLQIKVVHLYLTLMKERYEQGLTSVGLHMTEGSRLWAAYRTFEQRVLATMSDQSEGDKYAL